MNKGEEIRKKEWHRPAYDSLKFSETLGGNKRNLTESVTLANGKHHGGSMTVIS